MRKISLQQSWHERRLIDLAHYLNGYAFKPDDWSVDGTRIIRIEQLNNPEGQYDHYCGWFPEANAIDDGDLIFSWSATLKVAIWRHGKGVLNQHLFRVVPKNGFDKKFIFYVLDFNMDALGGGSHGSTMKHIKRGELERYTVGVPILPEQERIAEILSTVDEAIEHTEALIAKMQQVKTGLMHDLFTRGITPGGQLRPTREEAPELYKESPLGWIPKSWDVEKLGQILSHHGGYLQTGPFGSQLHANEYQSEGVPVVMPQDINDGRISDLNIARISEDRAVELLRHRMRRGDIVIARRGELSRAAAISEREDGWLCGTGCFLLRLGNSEFCTEFASNVYRQNFVQRQIAGRAVGTTMPSLNNSVMSELWFPFCAPGEQLRIVERLEAVEHQHQTLFSELVCSRNVKSGLMEDLLCGKCESWPP